MSGLVQILYVHHKNHTILNYSNCLFFSSLILVESRNTSRELLLVFSFLSPPTAFLLMAKNATYTSFTSLCSARMAFSSDIFMMGKMMERGIFFNLRERILLLDTAYWG